jgi:type I restriction enzyme M protein
MTSMQQRAALQSQIWKIANDVRGSVDGWDFKQYVLGTLFYRLELSIAENIVAKSVFKFSLLLALATTLQKS